MKVSGRVDAFQRRRPALGVPLAVIYKYIDDQGAYLAALITYYGFISLFPLLLLLSSVLGYALENNPEWQARIMESAFRQVPVIGDQVERAQLQGNTTAVVIGAIGALFGALGVAQAMQNALNAAWYVPRDSRPNPVMARARSTALLLVVALFLVATTVLSQADAALVAIGVSDQAIGVWGKLVSGVITGLLFLVISRYGTSYPVTVREALPGSVLGVLAWQGLQNAGTEFVRSFVAGATATNGVFAVVLGLLAWIYLASVAFVLCTELNVVLALGLYPRALLTPLTDDVDLTEADVEAYAGIARAQRLKGFQTVQVSFEHDGQYRSARLRREERQRLAELAQEETCRRAAQARRNRENRRLAGRRQQEKDAG
ncbi:YihY/virulence factor BrkB family protein [Austwickia chelonae]|uniref:YihY/virulence factor BrkB family protein n=1 Tax=Austwickia chelonae TaxID=100225 RepID=UPI000E22B8E3|nr:YihY/virulence factor BrkB family protein [Austwickia chelonae]